MFRYYVHFKAKAHVLAPVDEYARTITLPNPIEYDSDITLAAAEAAKTVQADAATALNWYPLKGEQRP